MRKRILSIMMALVLGVSLLALPAIAEETTYPDMPSLEASDEWVDESNALSTETETHQTATDEMESLDAQDFQTLLLDGGMASYTIGYMETYVYENIGDIAYKVSTSGNSDYVVYNADGSVKDYGWGQWSTTYTIPAGGKIALTSVNTDGLSCAVISDFFTAAKRDTPAMLRKNLANGETYTYTNAGAAAYKLFTSGNSDYVVYNADGSVKDYGWGQWSTTYTIPAGGTIALTSVNTDGLFCTALYEFFTAAKRDTPAMLRKNLANGETYTYTNAGAAAYKLFTSGNSDYVVYNADGSVKDYGTGQWSTTYTIPAGGKITLTAANTDGLSCAAIYDFFATPQTVKVTGISLNKSVLLLTAGSSEKLTATVNPFNATNKNVEWSSSNASVATISTDGTVTAKAVGTAIITVTTVDGGYQATCTVNVSESSGSGTGNGYKNVQVPVREKNDTSVEQKILDQMNPSDLLADMSFGNDTLRGPSITIHKKTFYLFEMEMNADIKITDKVSIQVKVDNEKKTFKVLLGYKLLKGSTAITGDPNSRDEKHDFWDSYTQAKSLYKLVSSKNTSPSVIQSKFKQQYDRLQTFQTDMLVKAEGSFSGYMELSYETGKLEFSEGGAILGIKVNKTLSHRISAFPAAYATLKFELSAEDKIVVSKGESKPLLDMQFTAGFNTAVGLGLGKNTGIYQAYVEGGLEGVLELIATTAGLRDASTYPLSVTLSGSLYLEYKAKGLILSAGDTKRKELGKLGLYPRLELLDAGDYVAVSMSDFLATAKPITRDYLNSAGKGASLLGVLDDYSYSKENLYPYCEPTLIVFPNGEMLMVWVDDLGEKADNERTTLVYSSYSAGKWSSVSAIHENGAYNDHPVLCQNGNSVYLIWMRADSPAQGDWDEMTMLQHMELCYATYDMSSKSFSSSVVISDTNNALAETDYSIAANDNEVAVTWIQNSENDLFMSEGTNSIYLRTFKDGAWGDIQTLLSTEQQIASLKVTEGDNGWSVIYSLCDAEVESPDVVTYQRNNGDTLAKVLDQITESVSYVDGHSYYLRESELYCDGNSTGLTGVTNFNVVSNDRGTVILALVPTGFTCELFASYYNAGAKTWGDWIQMTAFEKYIRDYSAVLNEDGELVVALNLVDVDADATDGLYKNATLVVIKDMEYRDMVMSDTISYDDDAVVPGSELELGFEVTNNSRETLTGIAVELNVNGVKVTKNIECGIAPGMTETLFTTYVLPQSLNKFTLSLTGTPNYSASENRTDNNSATVEIGFADLTIQASQPRRENGNWIVDLEVANQGYEAAESGKVTVHGGNVSGNALSVLDVTALAVGAKTTVSYTLPESYAHSQDTDTMNALQFSLTSDTQERNYGNNEDRIVFGNLESKWSVLKESNSTIKVTCSDTSIGGQFILGVYDESGKFLKAQIQSASQSEVAFSITEATADNVSVFWLDDEYRPLEAAVKYSLK